MKINPQWQRHVQAWRESGMSQADYCRQQGLNPKTFSKWARGESPGEPTAPLEVIPVQVTPSSPATEAAVVLKLTRGVQLELSTAVSPRWLAKLLQCLV
jgi:transposase-like protein